MAKSKKNIGLIILSVIIALVAIGGLASIFLLNYNTYCPDKPILLDDGSNFYLKTSLNTNYAGYRFKFVDSQDNEIIVDSKENVINTSIVMEKGALVGKEYKVSTCYLGKNVGNNSQFSEEIDWKCQVYLSSSTVVYDSDYNKLTWREVENADYYRVYYNDKGEEVYSQTEETSLDLQTFTGGEKTMYVVAYSNDENYKASGKSNVLDFQLKHLFSSFQNLAFDKDTLTLTAENHELLTKVMIRLDETDIQNIKFVTTMVADEAGLESVYKYEFDLTTVYDGQTKIGLYPADIDEYNIYKGDIISLEI